MTSSQIASVITSVCITCSTLAAGTPSIVPKPTQYKSDSTATFTIKADTRISCTKETAVKANQLASLLEPATGLQLQVTRKALKNNSIRLVLDPTMTTVGPEGYQLSVRETQVLLKATTEAGLFYGFQTMFQLLPVQVYSDRLVKPVSWQLPCTEIVDTPRYGWRGMMLDVSRYFLDKAFILRYLDIMAMHKMNTFHWHLVDDCGWRIEIKKYPKLTTLGAFRGEGIKRYGGYYSQEDIKEIVQYAADRHITIVPEIELPAHVLSAIVAYPHLSCTGKQHVLPDRHFISRDLYCAGKDSTWEYLNDVFAEVLDLFPGTYIHVGGDEAKYDRWRKCPDCQKKIKEEGLKNEHELQGWMTTRIEKMLAKHNRRIIGWDEILKCGVSTSAGLMPWYRMKSAVTGAKRGNPLVMAPTGHCYFDTPESKLPGELPGATWLKPVTLSKAYNWNPRPKGLTDDEAKTILGGNGCIWTDQILNRHHLRNIETFNERRAERYVEYFSLPRMAALAEVLWTPRNEQDWKDFSQRMGRHYNRYTAAGYHFRLPVPEVNATTTAAGVEMTVSTPVENGTIRYTTDGTYPHIYSPIYSGPVTVENKEAFKAIVVSQDNKHRSLAFEFKKENSKFAKYGKRIGYWKAGKIAKGKAKVVTFDATGKVDKKGTYQITFMQTSGQHRLDIDWIKGYKNHEEVAKDRHHGYTGGSPKGNTYTLTIPEYETGASYKIKAAIYGGAGTDSNGIVLIKRIK